MAKFNGQITLEFIDCRTGGRSREPEVICNQITEQFYSGLTGINGGLKDNNLLSYNNWIGVSSNSSPAIAGVYTTIGDIKGSGVTMAQSKNHPLTDSSSWTNRPEQDPPYAELFYILQYPGAGQTRSFQTVFLAQSSSASDSTPVYAYVVLPTPVVQQSYEFINIYYKIINAIQLESATSLSPTVDTDIVNGLLSLCNSTSQGGSQFVASEFIAFPRPTQDCLYLRRSGSAYVDKPSQGAQYIPLPTYFAQKVSVVIPVQQSQNISTTNDSGFVGAIINSVGIGYCYPKDSYYWIIPFELDGLDSEYQGYFPHGANATTPFIDISSTPQSAAGTGTIAIAGTWGGSLPEHYQIRITGTGAVGVSTYKIRRKRATGFLGNTYVSGRLIIPYVNHKIATFDGFYGFDNTKFLRITKDKVASWDSDGICLIDLSNGNYTILDADSIGLGASEIAQIACDGKVTGINGATDSTKIWVACRASGLWEIDLELEVCDQLSTDPCYAVDVGYQGKVFAVFGGVNARLSNSDNFATPLSFSVSAITTAWSQVKLIKCDPNSAIFNTLLHYGSSGATVWWNTATPSGATGPVLAIANQNSIEVSDTDSSWFGVVAGGFQSSQAHYLVKLTFGATTKPTISSPIGTACAPNPCILGDKLLVQYSTNTSNPTGQAYSLHDTSDGSLIDRFDFFGGGWGSALLTPSNNYLIYMGEAIALYGSISENYAAIVSPFNNQGYAFEEYGWSGSQWVLGASGSRTTHATAQAMPGGMTITFANGTSGTSFVATDYMDVFFNKGLLKSNTKSFPFTHFVNFRKTVEATIAGSSLLVPLSSPYTVKLPKATGGSNPDPDFLKTYLVHASFFSFNLDGNPVSKINIGGQAPAVGEVTVAADGTLSFNAADSGRVITSSKYTYIVK